MQLRFLPLLFLMAGCVSQGKYEAVQSENDRHASLLKTEQEKTKLLTEQMSMVENRLSKINQERTDLEMSVDEMKIALADIEKRKMEAEKRVAEFRDLVNRFRSLIDSGKLKVKTVEGRMVVELATDVLFPSGSAQLSKEGSTALGEVAMTLSTLKDRSFQIEGHTDNVPIGTAQYPSNWELAAARSLTVVKVMLASGMPAERISAASFGEARPAQSNDTEEGKMANRRIEIVLLPDLSSLPGFDELNELDSPLQP